MEAEILETLKVIAELLKLLVLFKFLDYSFKILNSMGIFRF